MSVTLEIFFDLSSTGGQFLTLDHPTKGVLDSATYVLAGDLAVDVTSDVQSMSIRRGRSRGQDEYDAGSCTATLLNLDRDYDPEYASSPYTGNVKPGKRVVVSDRSVVLFDGFVEDWNLGYELGGFAQATIVAADALAKLGHREFLAWTTTAQDSGARITAILDRNEVAFSGGVDIDTGQANLQADNVSHGSNVLNYMQLVSKTEQGYLYVTADGVLKFANRHAALNPMGAVTFTDVAGADIPYSTISVEYGSEFLYTRVSVDREGGTAQTVTDTTAKDAYDIRTLTLGGLLYDNDSQSLDTANYLLNKYKQPELRVAQLRVPVHGLTDAQQGQVLRLDLTDVVDVVFSPPGGGAAITRTSIVEGIAHDITPVEHWVTFDLGDTDNRLFFILDDADFGVLDLGILAF